MTNEVLKHGRYLKGGRTECLHLHLLSRLSPTTSKVLLAYPILTLLTQPRDKTERDALEQ